MKFFTAILFLILSHALLAQDTAVTFEGKQYSLPSVTVFSGGDYVKFLQRIKYDTTFYKAFKNLRVLNYTSLNDIQMLDKKGKMDASLHSKTKQVRTNGCRKTEVIEEQTSGDFYDKKGNYNYFTAELYASLFFAKQSICGETNIVAGSDIDAKNKKGIDKHKEQLKMLLFNPGKKISGIPFMGDKVNIFDEEASQLYDFSIENNTYQGKAALVFTAVPKADADEDDIVIDKLITWFDANDYSILARDYSLSYRAGVYNFDVNIAVEMQQFEDMLVPKVMRYSGNWAVMFKQKERAVFTATLFDFKK